MSSARSWKVAMWIDHSATAQQLGVPVEILDQALPPTQVLGYVEAATGGEAIPLALARYRGEGITIENAIITPVPEWLALFIAAANSR